MSWGFVKVALLLHYFGQGPWLLTHVGESLSGYSPFYARTPQWFLLPGMAVTTVAAIIAAPALITGSLTLAALR